jgi:hypothetical protein
VDKVLSRDVHRLLRGTLDPVLRPLGFVRTPRAAWCSYTIERSGGWQTCWVQLNAWGWRPVVGSALTLEVQLADEPDPGQADRGRRMRWTHLSTAADLREARSGQEAIASSPPPVPHEDAELVEDGRLLDDYLGKLDVGWVPGLDVWLRYRRAADVEHWGEFFARRMPAMLERHLELCGTA